MSQTDLSNAPAVPTRLAIFTDFDGTLVEIAESPDDVDVPVSLAHQLERAARELDSAFAVITGREIAVIDRFLSPLILPVAGAHGTQRRRADGTLETADAETIHSAETIANTIAQLAIDHPELLVEAKDGAVALHYRQAPELEAACRRAMQQAVDGVHDFTLVEGKMVIEARPKGITKGTALRAFMSEEPFLGRTPIFIGDDTTDEDAFIAAQDLGGVGIKLGEGDTAARMRIANVASVHALIQGLGDIAARERDDLIAH